MPSQAPSVHAQAPDEFQTRFAVGADWLSAHDAVLAPVIARYQQTPIYTPHQDYYGAVVNAIIGQQLSVKAAASIRQRFVDLFDGQLPSPEVIIQTSHDALRSAGLSNAKANYIRDLAEHVLDGRITFDKIPTQSNEQIITELTDVKGIGEWTAHMFLLFCVGRLDVLAIGDLGVRNGIRALYNLPDAPTPDHITELAASHHWRPYESVACWFIWRSLENIPA